MGVLAHSVDDVTLSSDSDANLENEEEGEEDVVVVKEEKLLYDENATSFPRGNLNHFYGVEDSSDKENISPLDSNYLSIPSSHNHSNDSENIPKQA